MAYTAPNDLFTSEEAILSLASSIADEDRTNLGNGTINGALDVLADALADQNVEVPPMNAGAILALAQYVSGGGGGGDFTTAHVTVTSLHGGVDGSKLDVCVAVENEGIKASSSNPIGSGASIEFDAILYTDGAVLVTGLTITATSGAIQQLGGGTYLITGDCTITTA